MGERLWHLGDSAEKPKSPLLSPSFAVSFCPSIYLSVSLSASLRLYLSLAVCLSIYIPVSQYVSLCLPCLFSAVPFDDLMREIFLFALCQEKLRPTTRETTELCIANPKPQTLNPQES